MPLPPLKALPVCRSGQQRRSDAATHANTNAPIGRTVECVLPEYPRGYAIRRHPAPVQPDGRHSFRSPDVWFCWKQEWPLSGDLQAIADIRSCRSAAIRPVPDARPEFSKARKRTVIYATIEHGRLGEC